MQSFIEKAAMAARNLLVVCAAHAACTHASPMYPIEIDRQTFTPTATATDTTLGNGAEMALGGPDGGAYQSPAWLPSGVQSLAPALSQMQTNGGAQWNHNLSEWLWTPGQPMPFGIPWGAVTARDTNTYNNVPYTGVTRPYSFTVSQGKIAPDGVETEVILVNGQFPGPLIEANWGDWIEVTVTNALASEGTALHWHGLLQRATPYMDGVPGVQMCPIAPGNTFTYLFQADLYGTSWWHSHYSAQYAGGLFGPMVIHGPVNAQYDEDIGPVMLTDWYHDYYYTLVEQTMSPVSANVPIAQSNNNLINGKMNYPCAKTTLPCTPNAGLSTFNFVSGKKYRLRLINSGAEAVQKFSIDNHTMTVIANDFTEIQPYETDVITLGVGQRSDIIVEATGNYGDAVWMRSNIAVQCSLVDGISPNAVAVIYYEGADTNSVPTTVSTVPQSELETCGNDALDMTQPFSPMTPSANPSTVETISITLMQNNTANEDESYFLWYMNNSTFRIDYNDPVLLDAKEGQTEYRPELNVYNTGTNSTVRVVLVNEAVGISHPMHLHGHTMYILAEGFGSWDGTIVNADNPQRRDVQTLQGAQDAETPAYIVVQWDQDNPGVWPFHCVSDP